MQVFFFLRFTVLDLREAEKIDRSFPVKVFTGKTRIVVGGYVS
jgi:hypothetical protein